MNYGGLAAKAGKGPLWKFTDKNDGSFTCPDPEYISNLYFPIMNEAGMRCWVTPELKGDVATAYHHYLTTPTVTDELWRSSSNRNFWIQVRGHHPWSAHGVSADRNMRRWETGKDRAEESFLEAGIGWFKMIRKNHNLGLQVSTTIFVPSAPDFVELMLTEVKNIGTSPITYKATAATPLFGRSTENLRDHKQVTTLFQRVWIEKEGVRIKGNIYHDERGGHVPNHTHYAMYGFDQQGDAPCQIWGNMQEFIGQGGTLDNPEALVKDHHAPLHQDGDIDGQEAIGALQFAETTLQAGETKQYQVMHTISDNTDDFTRWKSKYNTAEKTTQALEETIQHWQNITGNVTFETEDHNFNNWCRWLNYQLKCRQVYGNAYLPDFDYGKGGRGWRDLWQDLLSIFLIDPASARTELQNNFLGVRVDGTNANLIGNNPGEFFTDVNHIDRTWSDHSAWPTFVVNFYIQQSGDLEFLLTKVPYFKDATYRRSRDKDQAYTKKYGTQQRTEQGEVYEGSILEHMLLQNTCSFYNVGAHNNILLDCADWNDTYDNARQKGETACFHHFFAKNLSLIADLLKRIKDKGYQEVTIFKEACVLFDTLPGNDQVDYSSPEAKQKRLQAYYDTIGHNISGETTAISIDSLIEDLRSKSNHMIQHLRENEKITTQEGFTFFNGHYDDDSIKVHGDHPKGVRIDLTSQVLPTMMKTATDEEVKEMYASVQHYLHDEATGGLRLNTNLNELKLNLGRVAGFAYGFKEHGSKWMHQNIMYLYGLYNRGFIKEGYEVFKGIYQLVMQSDRSKVFPSIPSFFNRFGEGQYVYLTGSAAWFVLSFTTQVFGVKGIEGDLCLAPRLTEEQFGKSGEAAILCSFRSRRIRVNFINKKRLAVHQYRIQSIIINGQKADVPFTKEGAIIPWKSADQLLNLAFNQIEVELG